MSVRGLNNRSPRIGESSKETKSKLLRSLLPSDDLMDEEDEDSYNTGQKISRKDPMISLKKEFPIQNIVKPFTQSILALTSGNYFGDEEGFYPKVKKFNIRVISARCKVLIIPKKVILVRSS